MNREHIIQTSKKEAKLPENPSYMPCLCLGSAAGSPGVGAGECPRNTSEHHHCVGISMETFTMKYQPKIFKGKQH
jgi:hypothetical protein